MDTQQNRLEIETNQYYGIVLVIIATMAFSSKSIWIKLLYREAEQIDAISIMALRMTFAIPIYLLVATFLFLRQRPKRFSGKGLAQIILLSFFGYYSASFLDISGLAYISAGLERMILYLYPTMVVLMVAYRTSQPIVRRQRMALLLSYIGIAMVFIENFSINSGDFLLGSLLVFGSALSFSIFSVFSVDAIRSIGSMRFTVSTMLLGSVMTLTHYASSHGASVPIYSFDAYSLGAVLAIVSTVIPSFLMAEGVRRIGANRSAMLGSMGPVSTIILGMIILTEPISVLQIIGSTIILIAVFMLARKKQCLTPRCKQLLEG